MEHPTPPEMIGSAEQKTVHDAQRPNTSTKNNGFTTLDRLAPMQVAVVQQIDAENFDAARLKRLGICEGRQVQMVKAGDPLIIRVVGTRVGISARLAPAIQVHPCSSDEELPHSHHAATPLQTFKSQTKST